MELYEYTVHELMDMLEKKEIKISDITKSYADRINEKENDVNAFVTVLTEDALNKSKKIEESGESNSKFQGIPIGIKDVITMSKEEYFNKIANNYS